MKALKLAKTLLCSLKSINVVKVFNSTKMFSLKKKIAIVNVILGQTEGIVGTYSRKVVSEE